MTWIKEKKSAIQFFVTQDRTAVLSGKLLTPVIGMLVILNFRPARKKGEFAHRIF